MADSVRGLITLHIQRFNPKADRAPHFQTFQLLSKETTLLMALDQIRDTIDESLSYRDYCCMTGPGCGSCLMTVDGKTQFACVLPLKAGAEVAVEPLTGFQVVKDLVVDFSRRNGG